MSDVPTAVDYHCHLDLYPNFEREFSRCTSAKIATLAVTTTPKAWPRNKEIGDKSSHVRVALGLHPQLIAERAGELGLFERYFTETRFIGEIGLDASPRYYSTFGEQKRVFERVLQLCADAGDKILSIHSVRAAREVVNCIELLFARSRSRAVLHWFTGAPADARRASDLGCFFSVNEQMLANPAARRIVEVIPTNRILTETDGPFVQSKGRAVEPGQVIGAVEALAQILHYPVLQTQELILKNLAELERHD